jgi:hypothetical protein
MKPLLFSALVLAFASPTLAQHTSKLDCVLATLNLDSPNPETIRKQPVKQFAGFQVDNPGEEERITKFFRLPNSKWFVVASLYSTDESMPSNSGADSLSMELSLAKRRRRNIFISPAYASAELPYGNLDIGRVDMIFRTAKHRTLVAMQCKAVN